jgi:hypothetical protein
MAYYLASNLGDKLRGCVDRRVVSVYFTDPAEMRDVQDLSEP